MNLRTTLLSLWMCCIAAPVAAAPAASDLSSLTWLRGCWFGHQGDVAMEEHWSSPAGGGLVGMHKDTRQGRLVSFEFFRIVPEENRGVCYLTSPNGAPPTTFCAIEIGKSRVVFENLEHDFPQRILYWLDGKDHLHARIEGMVDGELKLQEWTWSRCPGTRR